MKGIKENAWKRLGIAIVMSGVCCISGCGSSTNVADKTTESMAQISTEESTEVVADTEAKVSAAALESLEKQSKELSAQIEDAPQQTMNQLSAEIYQLWDEERTAVLAQLQDTVSEDKWQVLEEAEGFWLTCRDQSMEAYGLSCEGGSLEALLRNSIGAEITREHVYQLCECFDDEVSAEIQMPEEIIDYSEYGAWKMEELDQKEKELEAQLENADQATMNQISGELYTLWDDKLNEIWKGLKKGLPEKEMEALTQSQRAWISFKEKQMEYSGMGFEGGSIHALMLNTTGEDITKARVCMLLKYYAYLAEEGSILDDTQTTTDKVSEMEAYAQFLANTDSTVEVDGETLSIKKYPYYAYVDINQDGVNELFVSTTDEEFLAMDESTLVLQYVDGQVKPLFYEWSAAGSVVKYMPEEQLLICYSRCSGEGHVIGYQLKDGELEQYITLDYWQPHHYYEDNEEEINLVNEQKVSEEDASEQWEKYFKNVSAIQFEKYER